MRPHLDRRARFRALPARRAARSAVVGLALLVTFALGASNFAAASTTYSAPFHHSGVTVSDNRRATSCATATIAQAAHFSLTNGLGGLEDRATAGWCASSRASVDIASSVTSQIALQIGVAVSTASNHVITATITIADLWSQSLTAGTCTATSPTSSCHQESSVNLSVCGYLYDLGRHRAQTSPMCGPSLLNQTSFLEVCSGKGCATNTTGGAGSGQGTTTGTIVWKAWMVPWNKYYLEIDVNATVFDLLQTNHMILGSGASASASLDIHTATPAAEYVQLNSIVLS